MAVRHVEAGREQGAAPYLALMFAAAVVCGAAISVLAFALARYGPSGGSWSFRGNGALAAYALGPAALAGGWTAAVLHRRVRSWAGLAGAAGAGGAGLALLDALLLPLFGVGADQAAGPVVLLALAAWTVIAPVAAWWLTRRRPGTGDPSAVAIAAAVLWTVGSGAGLFLIGMVIPAGS